MVARTRCFRTGARKALTDGAISAQIQSWRGRLQGRVSRPTFILSMKSQTQYHDIGLLGLLKKWRVCRNQNTTGLATRRFVARLRFNKKIACTPRAQEHATHNTSKSALYDKYAYSHLPAQRQKQTNQHLHTVTKHQKRVFR